MTLRNWLLLITGCFALAWCVHRAQVQSITIDEANTYHGSVKGPWRDVWHPASNTHILNSILIRLLVSTFGLGHLTMRGLTWPLIQQKLT